MYVCLLLKQFWVVKFSRECHHIQLFLYQNSYSYYWLILLNGKKRHANYYLSSKYLLIISFFADTILRIFHAAAIFDRHITYTNRKLERMSMLWQNRLIEFGWTNLVGRNKVPKKVILVIMCGNTTKKVIPILYRSTFQVFTHMKETVNVTNPWVWKLQI